MCHITYSLKHNTQYSSNGNTARGAAVSNRVAMRTPPSSDNRPEIPQLARR